MLNLFLGMSLNLPSESGRHDSTVEIAAQRRKAPTRSGATSDTYVNSAVVQAFIFATVQSRLLPGGIHAATSGSPGPFRAKARVRAGNRDDLRRKVTAHRPQVLQWRAQAMSQQRFPG